MDLRSVRSNSRFTALQAHPKMELREKKLDCNGVRLNLGRKPLAAKVISAFMNDAGRPVTRETLVKVIAPKLSELAATSPGCTKAREQCLNRLMSRLRSEFKAKFQGVVPEGTYWFHYVTQKKSWLLYKLPGEGPDRELYA